MNRYGFTVRVEGIDVTGDNYEDALYEAGCDDALVLVVNGNLCLDFYREGRDFDEAVASAQQNVQRAGGNIVRVEPLPD